MISEIIKTLQGADYYGGGEEIERAKGKYELVTTWRGMKRKLKRLLKRR